jgi:xanthine/uracil/vitamin C permease (AzgA family)
MCSLLLLLLLLLLQLGKYFDIEGRNTYLTAEMRAGCVAFLTISYIIAVNPGEAWGL